MKGYYLCSMQLLFAENQSDFSLKLIWCSEKSMPEMKTTLHGK